VEALYERITVPALHIGGWYDSFNEGTIRNFVRLTELQRPAGAGRQQLLVGPWGHVPWGTRVGGVDFGAVASGVGVDQAMVAFLRRHLDPAAGPEPAAAPVRYFVLFEQAWREDISWPPRAAVEQSWYLHSAGHANTACGDGALDLTPPGAEPCDVYVYNPEDPLPSNGGHSCCFEASAPIGAHDQAALEQRRDVLVYTSAPFAHDVRLAGPVRLELWVDTPAPDADYVGKLCLVSETVAINIAEGLHRASAELSAHAPGRPLHLTLQLRNVAALVRAGQRLRLEVTGGSFPMYDINPQSGVRPARAQPREYAPAAHAVYHEAAAPSRLIVTVES
jgi:putative CocE/NonD family hydrolase